MRQVLFGTRRRKVVVLVVIAVLAASAAALAAWLTTGSGTGKAKIGSVQSITFADATTAPTKQCVPGGTCDLAVKITNPNSVPLTITSVAPNGNSSNPAGTPGCVTSSFVTAQTLSGLSIAVPAGTTDNVIIPDAVKLDAAAPTACQGTTWTVPITANVST